MFLHHLDEPVKEIRGIVRAGRGLRVVLNGEERYLLVNKPFESAVIQIHVAQFNVRIVERLDVHAKPVILRSDFHLPCRQVFHRLVCAPMAELELERLPSQGQSDQLVPQANPENGPLADLRPDGIDRIGDCCRVSGPVAQEKAVRVRAC